MREMRSNPHMLSHPLWGDRSPAIASAGLLLLFTVLSSSCGNSSSPEPTGIGPATSPAIGFNTLTLVDTTRPTAPNRGAPGAPSRTLPTDIYYPTTTPTVTIAGLASPVDCLGGPPSNGPSQCLLISSAPLDPSGAPYPLIVLSHGFGNGKEALRYFAIALAQHGYVVAAPTFPLSNENTPGGPVATDLVGQAGDVSFLFDVFLGEVPSVPSPFPGSIDGNRLGTGGRSLGGSTTFVDSFFPADLDPRIRAAAPISPSYDVAKAVVGEGFFTGITTPILIVGGSEDDLAPFPANQQLPYDLANPPKILVEVLGEGHVPEVEQTNRSLVAFFDAYLRGRTSELAELDSLQGVRVEKSL